MRGLTGELCCVVERKANSMDGYRDWGHIPVMIYIPSCLHLCIGIENNIMIFLLQTFLKVEYCVKILTKFIAHMVVRFWRQF